MVRTMIKWTLKASVALAVVAGGAYFAKSMGWVSMPWDKAKPLTIDKTANVVTQVRGIHQLITMNYHEDLTLQTDKTSSWADNKTCRFLANTFGNDDGALAKDHLVVLGKGHVGAGFDLSKVTRKDVLVKGDTLYLTLPKPEILQANINQSEFEIFEEEGNWSHQEVMALEREANQKLQDNAKASGILKKAEDSGIAEITNICKAFGFSEVYCTVKAA